MDRVVVSIGGSIIDRKDTAFLRDLARTLRDASRSVKLYVVAGGGEYSRSYIRAGRALGADEKYLDLMGIKATRMNAMLLGAAIGREANPCPPASYAQAIRLAEEFRITIMGGTRPGRTTDGVAARLAEKVGARRLVNASNVDGIYTKDPRRFKDARLVPKMTYEELIALSRGTAWKAGPTVIFDIVGSRICKRAGIPLLVLDGRDLASLRAAILGNRFKGPTVS